MLLSRGKYKGYGQSSTKQANACEPSDDGRNNGK